MGASPQPLHQLMHKTVLLHSSKFRSYTTHESHKVHVKVNQQKIKRKGLLCNLQSLNRLSATLVVDIARRLHPDGCIQNPYAHAEPPVVGVRKHTDNL
jgi:hypothetical protein